MSVGVVQVALLVALKIFSTTFVAFIQLTFTFSKSTIETIEKGVKYVQN